MLHITLANFNSTKPMNLFYTYRMHARVFHTHHIKLHAGQIHKSPMSVTGRLLGTIVIRSICFSSQEKQTKKSIGTPMNLWKKHTYTTIIVQYVLYSSSTRAAYGHISKLSKWYANLWRYRKDRAFILAKLIHNSSF